MQLILCYDADGAEYVLLDSRDLTKEKIMDLFGVTDVAASVKVEGDFTLWPTDVLLEDFLK